MAEVKNPSLQHSASMLDPSIGYGQSDASTNSESKVSKLAETAKSKVTEQVEAKKGIVATQLGDVANALEETARTLESKGIPGAQRIAQTAAERIRQFSGNIEGRSVNELFQQAKQTFRESPLPVLLGFVALGFIGARLVRS